MLTIESSGQDVKQWILTHDWWEGKVIKQVCKSDGHTEVDLLTIWNSPKRCHKPVSHNHFKLCMVAVLEILAYRKGIRSSKPYLVMLAALGSCKTLSQDWKQGTGEMAPSTECLLSKHEDPSLIPRTHIKNMVWREGLGVKNILFSWRTKVHFSAHMEAYNHL